MAYWLWSMFNFILPKHFKMKKITFILFVLFCFVFNQPLLAQKDRTLTKGFSMKLGLSILPQEYGLDYATPGVKAGTQVSFQIGNQWYFKTNEKTAFGIMVNWFDVAFSAGRSEILGERIAKGGFEASLIELGPLLTVKLADKLALDGYYNLRPTLSSSAILNDSANGFTAAGFGFLHAVGAGIRYNVLYAGLELNLGNIKDASLFDTNQPTTELRKIDLKANHVRLLVGMKF